MTWFNVVYSRLVWSFRPTVSLSATKNSYNSSETDIFFMKYEWLFSFYTREKHIIFQIYISESIQLSQETGIVWHHHVVSVFSFCLSFELIVRPTVTMSTSLMVIQLYFYRRFLKKISDLKLSVHSCHFGVIFSATPSESAYPLLGLSILSSLFHTIMLILYVNIMLKEHQYYTPMHLTQK